MKIEERLFVIGQLNEAINAISLGKDDEFGAKLADAVRDRTFGNYAFDIWHTDDVKAQVQRLTDEEAQQVLEYAQRKGDGGLNLDLFDVVADQLFPEKPAVSYLITLDNELQLEISVVGNVHPTDAVDFHGHVSGCEYGGYTNGTVDYTLPEDKEKLQQFLCERHGVPYEGQ